jgi:MFS family permease
LAEKRIHYGATFAVLATAALSFSLLQSLIIPAIPNLEHTLHTGTDGATWLLTGYLLSSAIATPILGRMGDIIGKDKMIVIVLIAVSAGVVISAVATTLPIMLIGRIVQGVGGAVFPLAFGIIRDEFPARQVAGAIGAMSAILGLGVGAGIVLAGPIIEHLSYHWLFWIPLILSLGATLTTFVFVPDSPVRAPGGINWLGALLMSGWLTVGLLGVSYGPTWGWKDPTVLAMFGAAVVLIVLWVWAELRSDTPLVDMTMMRIPAVWTTNLAAVLFGFGLYAMFVTVPQFAQTPLRVGYGFGASVTKSGLYLLPFALAMLVIAPMTGRLSRLVGSKNLLVLGSLFCAACYGVLAVAHGQPWNIFVAAGLLGVGMAFGYSSMSNLIVEAVAQDQTGVATGMNTNIRNIGSALGSGIATSLVLSKVLPDGFPAEHGYELAFIVCGASLVVAAMVAVKIPRRAGPSIVESESHPALTAEAEVFVGAIAYTPEG